jgi:hypothetical protein
MSSGINEHECISYTYQNNLDYYIDLKSYLISQVFTFVQAI